MNEFVNLKFASLLHDIGKFYQRTGKKISSKYNNITNFGYNGAHSKWSADFVSRYWNSEIVDLVLYHHNKKNSRNLKLEDIIVKSDSHSARERVESDSKNNVLQSPLVSIFSKIHLEGKDEIDDCYVPLQALSLDNGLSFLKPTSRKVMEGWNLQPEYSRLWAKFEREMSLVKNPYDFRTVLSLLRKYTSTVPSAAYLHEADISLYDHLKTTCAISIARYNYSVDVGDLKKTSDNQEVYLAISGDISGIQDFIYKISSPQDAQSGMSKRLRGRSLYLSLLCDAIVEYILRDLNLDWANVLFIGGGRFTILAQNSEDAKKKLDGLRDIVNKEFIKRFNADLSLILAYTSFSGKEFENFNEVTGRLSDISENMKKHKFYDDLGDIFTVEEELKFQSSCSVCGNLIKPDDNLCGDCLAHESLGFDVANAKYMIKAYSCKDFDDFSIYFDKLNIGYIFKKSDIGLNEDIRRYSEVFDYLEVSCLNSTDFLNEDLKSFDNVSYTFNFIGNTVPSFNGDVLTFNELAKISKGADKLGVLKMDVDNLGKVFSNGLSSESSISRISTLSSMLDLFFSGFINNICREFCVYSEGSDEVSFEGSGLKLYKVGGGVKIPTIYINYSGGDDLLCIGPYDDIINFAHMVESWFKDWTCNNPSLSISAGISIVNHKFPIGKSAVMADEFLEQSKDCGRDKVSLFGEVLSWKSDEYCGFDDLMDFSKYLEENIEKGNISKGFLYSMLNIWDSRYESNIELNSRENLDFENSKRLEFKEYVPQFKYKLRTISNSKVRDELNSIGLKYIPWIKLPVSYVSLRMR